MYFTKLGISSDQLDVIIAAINLEYNPSNVAEQALLIAKNFKYNEEDVLNALKAHKAYPEEDFEYIHDESITHIEEFYNE